MSLVQNRPGRRDRGTSIGIGGWDRNAARATLGRELPTGTLSVVQRVHSSAIARDSASLPFHPGRSDSPSPVGDHGLSPGGSSQGRRRLSVGPHTPLTILVYPLAQHSSDPTAFNRALCPDAGLLDARHVPRAPLPLWRITPSGVTFIAT